MPDTLDGEEERDGGQARGHVERTFPANPRECCRQGIAQAGKGKEVGIGVVCVRKLVDVGIFVGYDLLQRAEQEGRLLHLIGVDAPVQYLNLIVVPPRTVIQVENVLVAKVRKLQR